MNLFEGDGKRGKEEGRGKIGNRWASSVFINDQKQSVWCTMHSLVLFRHHTSGALRAGLFCVSFQKICAFQRMARNIYKGHMLCTYSYTIDVIDADTCCKLLKTTTMLMIHSLAGCFLILSFRFFSIFFFCCSWFLPLVRDFFGFL